MRKLLTLLAVAVALALPPGASAGYAGKTFMPRDVAVPASIHWSGVGLVKAVATGLGESSLSNGAWHDNYDLSGILKSRDCGVYQINIPASAVGSSREFDLRTAALEGVGVYEVLHNNVEAAFDLYNNPWHRNGVATIRLWQPWVAYTTGWATFPRWYVFSQAKQEWVPTGRYVQQAIAGVVNYRLIYKKDISRASALTLARKYAATFGVTEGTLGVRDGIIAWTGIPAKPTDPPADGIGPRPKKNDGR